MVTTFEALCLPTPPRQCIPVPRQTPDPLPHVRYMGINETTGEYCCFERYERHRYNGDRLENYTIGNYQQSKYVPFQTAWFQQANKSVDAQGNYIGLWKGPSFQVCLGRL